MFDASVAGGAGYRDKKPRDSDGSYVTWWHHAVGHPGDHTVRLMLKRGLGEVNGVKVTQEQVNKSGLWCDTCAKAKSRASRHPARDQVGAGWPQYPNKVHGVDSLGDEEVISYWGNKHSTVIKDHHDVQTWMYTHRRTLI